MNENLKKRLPIIGVIAASLVLSAIAVFTAIKIFQSRQQSISPLAPGNQPLAQAPTSTSTPTPFPTSSPTPTLGLTGSPTPTASTSATLTPTKKPSATPTIAQELPDSGISLPTVVGISFGLILIIVSLLLAI